MGVLTNFLVNGASVVSSVAERRADLSALTQNANQALGAIASENRSFDQALVALPGTLLQANTTFHNLRPTLDDVDVLVNAAKPATKNLAPFLKQLYPVVGRSVPVFRDLNRALNLKGKSNDLADATGDLTALEKSAADAIPITVKAMQDSQTNLAFLRPYTPELMSAVAHLNQVAGYYDADGHYARVPPVGTRCLLADARRLQDGRGPNFTFTAQNAATVFNDYGALGGTNYNSSAGVREGPRPSSPAATHSPTPSLAAFFLWPANGAVPPRSPATATRTQTVPGP